MLKGDSINFGNYKWQVLDVINSRALLITENIIEIRWYHNQFVDITWGECEIRKYLNSEFYNQFSTTEKEKITAVTCRNLDNPWFRTAGGKDSTDNVFLLSLEEVCTYFGNSMAKLQNKGSQTWHIDDENNENRQAKYNDRFHWWRLRSPGYYSRTAASISKNGYVYLRGNGVFGRPRDGGGVRPALWLKIDNQSVK